MALLPANFSFTRQGLPILAGIALILSIIYMVAVRPDRELIEPSKQPAHATGALADSPRVAGAGVVEPSSEVIDIGTAVAGLVTDLRVTPGEFVEAGQPLFVVDQRSARARLSEANAAIAEARAAIRDAQTANATAQRQLALYQGLDDPAAVSRAEVIRAEGEASAASTRLELARARLTAAQAAAGSARTELERLTVRAPIAGQILAVNIRPGEFVSTMGGSSEPFIRMGETRPLHIRIDIDEDEAIRLERGARALVSPRGDATNQTEATFVRAEPLIVPKRSLTNSAAERVDVRVLQLIYALPEGARGQFTVGQQVDAFIPAKEAAQ